MAERGREREREGERERERERKRRSREGFSQWRVSTSIGIPSPMHCTHNHQRRFHKIGSSLKASGNEGFCFSFCSRLLPRITSFVKIKDNDPILWNNPPRSLRGQNMQRTLTVDYGIAIIGKSPPPFTEHRKCWAATGGALVLLRMDSKFKNWGTNSEQLRTYEISWICGRFLT